MYLVYDLNHLILIQQRAQFVLYAMYGNLVLVQIYYCVNKILHIFIVF